MNIHDRRILKSAAADALRAAPFDPKKQILLHTGAVLILSLLLTVIDYFLENAISGTGGLGGLGARSLLTTLQSCLRILQMVLLPFWQIGYTYVTLKFSRREETALTDLCTGFKQFLPVLRLLFFQSLLYFGLAMLSSYLGTFLFMMTPWSAPLMAAFMELMYGGSTETLDAVMEQVISEASVPLMVCGGIVFLALAAPFFYRFRLAQYVLLEEPEKGALNALRTSGRLMRGKAMALLKLDISFWWFYLLDLLVSAVCYADALLALLGITLPVSVTFAYFASFVLYLVLQLGLYWWRKNEVDTTYAVFYHALQQPQQKKPAPMPQKQPWTY